VERHAQHSHEEGEAIVQEHETLRSAAVQIGLAELEPPVLNETPLADDIVHQCGLGSFPASDPPSWWAQAGPMSAAPETDPVSDGYDLTELRTGLARFAFLPGEDDGEQLFGTGQP
jgi:hypothetical protein